MFGKNSLDKLVESTFEFVSTVDRYYQTLVLSGKPMKGLDQLSELHKVHYGLKNHPIVRLDFDFPLGLFGESVKKKILKRKIVSVGTTSYILELKESYFRSLEEIKRVKEKIEKDKDLSSIYPTDYLAVDIRKHNFTIDEALTQYSLLQEFSQEVLHTLDHFEFLDSPKLFSYKNHKKYCESFESLVNRYEEFYEYYKITKDRIKFDLKNGDEPKFLAKFSLKQLYENINTLKEILDNIFSKNFKKFKNDKGLYYYRDKINYQIDELIKSYNSVLKNMSVKELEKGINLIESQNSKYVKSVGKLLYYQNQLK
ncbi:MAG: hypothetical protein PWP03_798 [Candidatus Woesearchaeota archaeon]|nr:hypothetical protein [Candidatus Woesearchaeota archaeon]MDN5328160.1 hypothetical protein [Candidatus Woesearchaeota archaeon]